MYYTVRFARGVGVAPLAFHNSDNTLALTPHPVQAPHHDSRSVQNSNFQLSRSRKAERPPSSAAMRRVASFVDHGRHDCGVALHPLTVPTVLTCGLRETFRTTVGHGHTRTFHRRTRNRLPLHSFVPKYTHPPRLQINSEPPTLSRCTYLPPGIPLTEVATTEGSDPDYIANEGQSCFHCKTHLYSALEAVAAQAGEESRRSRIGDTDQLSSIAASSSSWASREGLGASASAGGAIVGGAGLGGGAGGGRRVVLFNGTNKDDKRDTTR